MTPIPLTVTMAIEPAASEAFSVLECDLGDARLLSPKEERVLAIRQHRQSLKLLSYHGITTREQEEKDCIMELDKSTAKGSSSTGHTPTNRALHHRVCSTTPNIRDEPDPGSAQGLQSGAKGEGDADRVGDKLQHMAEGLHLATE
ncbi:hypothetical protein TURU_083103 [Turdus rufiventris]|nr:hypothetical protein TURU_083103 [Turdus rufiventris]